MTFNIGRQSGGIINNVGRDQHVGGGQHGTGLAGEPARHALRALRDAVAAAGLDVGTASAAGTELDEMEAAVAAPAPDRPRFAAALDRLTRLLTAAGSLAAAGSALAGPLRALAAVAGLG